MNGNILPSKFIYPIIAGRASVSASKKGSIREKGSIAVKGSITVEAAAAVPLFFLAVVSLLYLMEMTAIQCAVRSGLQYAGRCAAQEGYGVSVLRPSQVEQDVIHAVGADRLDRSIVVGGSGGIDCSGSRMSVSTGIGELSAVYQMRLPIPVFRTSPVEYQVKMRVKAWTGYEKSGFGAEREDTAYVTESGLVYHKDYHCTYLDLSIRMVSSGDLAGLRNDSGGKYYACEKCSGGNGGVYITDSGDRYHGSVTCSGLKRTVYAVPLSEAVGKGACSRCGQ